MTTPSIEELEKLTTVVRVAVAQLQKPVRLRALNALDGFDRAAALFEIDREMASFRAITAQEEAAAALFRSLQIRRYPGAQRLDLWRHEQKAALWPVLDAARMALGEGMRDIEFSVSADPPEIRVSLKLAKYVGNLPPKLADAHLQLANPLDLLGSVGGKPNDFAKQIQAIVDLHGAASIRDHVRKTANARNTLLYASDQALPRSRFTLEGLAQRKQQALVALCLSIGILQTRQLQAYALQALECFLRILDRNDGIVMPYTKG